jgi:hypothetical protein
MKPCKSKYRQIDAQSKCPIRFSHPRGQQSRNTRLCLIRNRANLPYPIARSRLARSAAHARSGNRRMLPKQPCKPRGLALERAPISAEQESD